MARPPLAHPPLATRLAAALAEAGATAVFGLPGGGPNLDVVGAASAAGLRFVLAHGETAAAIMASTHGLLTGAPTPVVVTRGPGAASVVNGTAQATLDRFPLVTVTDTVPARSTARVAHQRIDQRALLAPVAKRSVTLTDATPDGELAALLDAARRWPHGAVHVDYDPAGPPPGVGDRAALGSPPAGPTKGDGEGHEGPGPDPASLDRVAVERARELLAVARRPVVIAGMEAAAAGYEPTSPEPRHQGGSGRGPVRAIRASLAALGCPVLTTYQAVGLVPTEDDTSAGLFTNGASERPLLEQADLIVTVGLDLVEPIPAPWAYDVPVIRFSAEPQRDAYLPAEVEVIGDPARALAAVTERVPAPPLRAWAPDAGADHRERVRERLRAGGRPEPSGFGPLELVLGLQPHHPQVGTVTVDAGAHFLAVMPFWPVAEPFRLLISNGLATMGFALPAAIGAALARPGEPVLAITGDGGLSMALAELETLARLALPVTVVVFDDAALSLIEIKQQPGHGGAEAVRYRPVDYAAVARAAGLDATVVTTADELAAALGPADSGAGDGPRWQRPRLIDARIDPATYPHLLAVTRG